MKYKIGFRLDWPEMIFILVIYTKTESHNYLDSFDLNHDGIFSGSEINTAQQTALKNYSSDTAIAFAPLFAIPYSLFYFIILYIGLKIFRK